MLIKAPQMVQNPLGCHRTNYPVFIRKTVQMAENRKKQINPDHKQILLKISRALKEIRYSEGLRQNELSEFGLSRRQIQRGESGCNLSLVKLLTLLDGYNYTLTNFGELIEGDHNP